MKLTTGYSIAVYTAEKCTLYDLGTVDDAIDCVDQFRDSPPSKVRLNAIQKSLSIHSDSADSNIIILVPDDWLSTSQHNLDQIIDSALLPLVALSYAVETTFSAPETLLFSYQKKIMHDQQPQLTVYSCSTDWAEQLSQPFTERGSSCFIMSITQWKNLKSGKKTWSYLVKQALSIYQPDYEKRKARKRRWFCLILFSVLIQSTAYVYSSSLAERAKQAGVDRAYVLEKKSLWASEQESNAFIESALTLVQVLPSSVRLVSFDGKDEVVNIKLTLSRKDLTALLEGWRKQYPLWHWEIAPISPHAGSNQQAFLPLPSDLLKVGSSVSQHDEILSRQEVVDVSVSIFTS